MTGSPTEQAALSDDTKAILLLCTTLGRKGGDGLHALSVPEYDALAESLRAGDLRPHHLLGMDPRALDDLLAPIEKATRLVLTRERLERLLERGGQLALALTKWTSAGVWVCSRADARYPSRYKRVLGRAAPLSSLESAPASTWSEEDSQSSALANPMPKAKPIHGTSALGPHRPTSKSCRVRREA